MPIRSNETAQRAINILNVTHGMSYPELQAITGVPAGTLWDIAHGKPIPAKWRGVLGVRVYRDLFAMPVRELRWALENRERY